MAISEAQAERSVHPIPAVCTYIPRALKWVEQREILANTVWLVVGFHQRTQMSIVGLSFTRRTTKMPATPDSITGAPATHSSNLKSQAAITPPPGWV